MADVTIRDLNLASLRGAVPSDRPLFGSGPAGPKPGFCLATGLTFAAGKVTSHRRIPVI
jgi:hypothetical protein